MSSIYSINSVPATNGVTLTPVLTPGNGNPLAVGYTAMVTIQVGNHLILFAYNKNTQKIDTYALSDVAPWVQKVQSNADLTGGPWDFINSLVLGNEPYLMTYRRDKGTFGFYQIANDLSISKPYLFTMIRNTPTTNFTTITPFTSLGHQYFIGYNSDDGTVAIFNLVVTSSTPDGSPPLLASNVWYHQWAKGWTNFAFFRLGGSNFFFKINKMKLNVNIDHINDNPALGTNEVGSQLQSQMPDAINVDLASVIPWSQDQPYLLTYLKSSGSTSIYHIHPDCLGWYKLFSSNTLQGVSLVIPYRIKDAIFTLFYS